jgi:predicted nucleotidyltransferase component of viral defense system
VKSEPRYQTAAGLRMALEERLNRQAGEKGLDVMRLRRHVAFDRFLARIFSGPGSRFVLKGGYAFELWLDRARATKDIDLSFKVGKGGRQENKKTIEADALLELLQGLVSANSRDFFEFIIGKSVMDLENVPYGGWRFPVEVRLAGYVFVRFSIDVAAGDLWLKPHDLALTTDWLGFAGISAPKIPVISREQQFAEKLHAYTRPRQTANSRVKDLVDLLMLIRMPGIDPRKMKTTAEKTFARRGTHSFPPAFFPPPSAWSSPFRKLARECGIEILLEQAVEEIRAFCIKHGLVA